MKEPVPGLYRTRTAHPQLPSQLPSNTLLYLGRREGGSFVVKPYRNHHNRWYWQEPVQPLSSEDLAEGGWVSTLVALPAEGFYVLPETVAWEDGGRWLNNAIVQLGYNAAGQGILFVAEYRAEAADNALFFSKVGKRIDDSLLLRLRWAPILPTRRDSPRASPTLH